MRDDGLLHSILPFPCCLDCVLEIGFFASDDGLQMSGFELQNAGLIGAGATW